MDMNDEQNEIYNQGFKAGQEHTEPSERTKGMFALIEQKLIDFDKKMNFVIDKLEYLLTQEDAEKTYATKLELEKIKSKINFYAWIVPFLTGIIGILTGKFL